MRIVGHGVDLVETQRILRMTQEHGDRFLCRCFTPGERDYALDRRRFAEHLAGRFAVKEAVFKALGTGWSAAIQWTDVEVVRRSTGQPTLRLHHQCERIARDAGIDHWLLSI